MGELVTQSKLAGGAEDLKWIRPTRQKRTRRTLEALLDATQRLANERPFDEISVVAICEIAGCSVPSFYRRFSDKEALLHALHARHIEAAIATARDALTPERWEGSSLHEIIGALIDLLARTDSQAAGLRVAAARRAVDDERFAERIRAARLVVFEGVRCLLLARRNELGHRDPDMAARFLIRMTYGALTHHFEDAVIEGQDDSLSDTELVDELARAALAYLDVHA